MTFCTLTQCALMQDVQLTQLLLDHGACPAATDSLTGQTALHAAARTCAGLSGTLLRLASRCPALLSRPDAGGEAPLHALCRGLPDNRCEPTLRALASKGWLTPQLLNALAGMHSSTPLALAAAAGSEEAVTLLLACGASPAAGSCRGCAAAPQAGAPQPPPTAQKGPHTCALGAAVQGRHYRIALTLLASGASPAHLSVHALEQAVEDGEAEVAAALLKGGLRVGAADAWRVLLHAVEADSCRMFQQLLDGGEAPGWLWLGRRGLRGGAVQQRLCRV